MSGFGCPLCWYYNRHRRSVRVITSVPYEEWLKEIGRKLEIGEVIMLGELLIKRTRDDKVKIAVEGGGEDER